MSPPYSASGAEEVLALRFYVIARPFTLSTSYEYILINGLTLQVQENKSSSGFELIWPPCERRVPDQVYCCGDIHSATLERANHR